MWHDIQTITDPNAAWWERGLALVSLGVTLFADINMLDGGGEAARAAEVGEEIASKGESGVAEMASSCGGGLSFVASTPVAIAGGKQAIGTLKVGEQVWAYNQQTKQMELEPILHVWINHDNDLVDLTISKPAVPSQGKATKPTSEVIHTNQKHPFLTVEKGFVPVGQIKLGMHVVEADGLVGVVSGWTVVPGAMTMYNLEVAQDHTFAVGVGMWVVHNCEISAGDETPQGLQFTDHAAEQANERNFNSEGIDNIVRKFRDSRVRQFDPTKPLNEQGTWRYQDSRGNVVVTNGGGDRIVTVFSHPPEANGTKYIPNKNGR